MSSEDPNIIKHSLENAKSLHKADIANQLRRHLSKALTSLAREKQKTIRLRKTLLDLQEEIRGLRLKQLEYEEKLEELQERMIQTSSGLFDTKKPEEPKLSIEIPVPREVREFKPGNHVIIDEFCRFLNEQMNSNQIRVRESGIPELMEVHSLGKLDPTPCMLVKNEAFAASSSNHSRLQPIRFSEKNKIFYPEISSQSYPIEVQSLRMVTQYLNVMSIKNQLTPLYDFSSRAFNANASGYRLALRHELVHTGRQDDLDIEWLNEDFTEGLVQSSGKKIFQACLHKV